MTSSEKLRAMIASSGLTTAQFAKMLRDTVDGCKITEGTLNRYKREARKLRPLVLFAIEVVAGAALTRKEYDTPYDSVTPQKESS